MWICSSSLRDRVWSVAWEVKRILREKERGGEGRGGDKREEGIVVIAGSPGTL